MKNIIIITGASSGMGREFAKEICKRETEPFEMWLVARREERLSELSQ